MLAIHILNVGHGDSIVLEFRPEKEEAAFGVIDSNAVVGQPPRALEKLRSLGAERLSFVAITHPHTDHFMGMGEIMRAYEGCIDALYTFPLEKAPKLIRKLGQAAKALADKTDSQTVARSIKEFLTILLIGEKVPVWETPASTVSPLPINNFPGITINAILPPAKVKGRFFESIRKGEVDFSQPHLNELSLAFLIEYQGVRVVLGGDGTYGNWTYQKSRWDRIPLQLSPTAVKLPHHGSITDSNELVLNILFSGNKDNAERFACISADGRTHPHSEVLEAVVRKGIKPYCTNLAAKCGNTAREYVKDNGKFDPVLMRFVNSVAFDSSERKKQPCQGDIKLVIEKGTLSVQTEHKSLCALRGDLDFLSNRVH